VTATQPSGSDGQVSVFPGLMLRLGTGVKLVL